MGDERAFFEWLERIEATQVVYGRGREIVISLRPDEVSEQSLREFIAVFYRYEVQMAQLQQFASPSNESWFKKRNSYWYTKVFGSPSESPA
jgi:hypothetical protein